MAGDKIKNATDKGKSLATSERKPLDLARAAAKEQEKLVLDSARRFLPGGMNQGESSKQQTAKQKYEQTKKLSEGIKQYQQGINDWMYKKHQNQDRHEMTTGDIQFAHQSRLEKAKQEYKDSKEKK